MRGRVEQVSNQLKNEVLAAQDAALDAVHAAERDVLRAAAKRDGSGKYGTEEFGSEITEEEEELKTAVWRRTLASACDESIE